MHLLYNPCLWKVTGFYIVRISQKNVISHTVLMLTCMMFKSCDFMLKTVNILAFIPVQPSTESALLYMRRSLFLQKWYDKQFHRCCSFSLSCTKPRIFN